MNNVKKMLPIGIVVACLMVACLTPALAADWRQQHSEITMGVITEENAEDRAKRWTPTRDYLSKELGVPVKWREATDYAGIIEALKAKKVELAWFGPASFARAWIVTDGQAVPLAAEIDKDGGFGYFGVIIVKNDSPYKSIDDLKGKRFGFADPNSTSGYQAPNFFLTEQGYKPEEFFGKTAFSGSHENSVKMLMEGNFDAVATWWTNEKKSNMSRMEQKGMIEPGQYRIIWKSPRLPSDPFTVPAWLPQEMQKDIKVALLDMPKKDPAAFKALMGSSQSFREVTLEDYQPVIRFVKANMEKRKE
ncbi:MAG: phosphonate ABC transporter substrate-binding protein [Deltaproteobacteria bacterium]|jgi:phosphonate transport system substrate-binding protein|nr:phosphonate ABC transporter substrate-binding protein [Deltaproteobacteria bacterium]